MRQSPLISERADGIGASANANAWVMKMQRHHRSRTRISARADARKHRPRQPWRGRGAPGRSLSHEDSERRRPRAGGWLRRKCRWAAALIRTSTGVAGFALEQERRAAQPTPWLGLLLWALACAGLFVSLLIESEELAREPRLAAHTAVNAQSPIGHRAFDLTGEIDHGGRVATEFSLPR